MNYRGGAKRSRDDYPISDRRLESSSRSRGAYDAYPAQLGGGAWAGVPSVPMQSNLATELMFRSAGLFNADQYAPPLRSGGGYGGYYDDRASDYVLGSFSGGYRDDFDRGARHSSRYDDYPRYPERSAYDRAYERAYDHRRPEPAVRPHELMRDPRDPREFRGGLDRDLQHDPASIRLVIQGDEVPPLIGKAGSIVKDLEHNSGARIKIPTAISHSVPPGDKLVIVSGSLEKRERAAKLIIERLRTVRSERSREPLGDNDATVRLLVPSDLIPLIIGRKGATISEMQTESGAHISIPQRMDRHAMDIETVITLHGSVDNCHKALCLVHQRLQKDEEPPRKAPRREDSRSRRD